MPFLIHRITKEVHHLFYDYKYQRKRKYPKGVFKKQYILFKGGFQYGLIIENYSYMYH